MEVHRAQLTPHAPRSASPPKTHHPFKTQYHSWLRARLHAWPPGSGLPLNSPLLFPKSPRTSFFLIIPSQQRQRTTKASRKSSSQHPSILPPAYIDRVTPRPINDPHHPSSPASPASPRNIHWTHRTDARRLLSACLLWVLASTRPLGGAVARTHSTTPHFGPKQQPKQQRQPRFRLAAPSSHQRHHGRVRL